MFLHDWSKKDYRGLEGIEALKSDFEIKDDDLEGVEIILASYSYENYSGDAFVLFKKDDEYYEVNGSHCSCYGLEGQWQPEKANLQELHHRLDSGQFGHDTWAGNEFADELKQILDKILGATQ